jgi:hypothetical protein
MADHVINPTRKIVRTNNNKSPRRMEHSNAYTQLQQDAAAMQQLEALQHYGS